MPTLNYFAGGGDPSLQELDTELLEDPFLFKELCWPDITFYDDQIDIIQSFRDNYETVVIAGNMLGKDFLSGFLSLWFFCSRVPARVVTSSVDHSQLSGVLWGEIRRFVDSSKYPLGLDVNSLMIRQRRMDGTREPRSELIGRVAQKGEGMLGRHIEKGEGGTPKTAAFIDEASGFEDIHYESVTTWAHRLLIIGNPYPCSNFFYKAGKTGDIPDDEGGFFRKVIKLRADRSPNIRLALREKELGLKVSHTEVTPGVMSYREYQFRRATWDPHRQSVGLDAEFYEGQEVRLYPEEWLERSHIRHEELEGIDRKGKSIGIDVAEGGDYTVWTVIDELGIIEQISKKTRDTSKIFGFTLSLGEQYGVPPAQWIFDLGGGGKQHVDYLNDQGFGARGVAFGSSPMDFGSSKQQKGNSKGTYKNRRAQMYGLLRDELNPDSYNPVEKTVSREAVIFTERKDSEVFAIPRELDKLIQQLRPLPLLYDSEGRMYLPPKNKPTPTFTGKTIVQMIGHSPDESDSLVLAIFGLYDSADNKMITVF